MCRAQDSLWYSVGKTCCQVCHLFYYHWKSNWTWYKSKWNLTEKKKQERYEKWSTFSSLWPYHILVFYAFIFILISFSVIFIFNFPSVCFENTALHFTWRFNKAKLIRNRRDERERDNPWCVMLFMPVRDGLTGDLFRELDGDHKIWYNKGT